MAPLTTSTTAGMLRACTRQRLLPSTTTTVAAMAAATSSPSSSSSSSFVVQQQQRRGKAEASFKGLDATRVPDFGGYKSGRGEQSNRLFGYAMAGTMGGLAAMGAKATVQDFLVNMSASADILAMAKVEVDLASIPEGKNVIIKWRGKPVFIRHRTEGEIKQANDVKWETLRDPQPDSDRVQKPEWLIMLGVCTHLGCVPIGEAGDFGGWFCPCHGSHYDISGRIRKGPAPLNLEVPGYDFPEEGLLVIG